MTRCSAALRNKRDLNGLRLQRAAGRSGNGPVRRPIEPADRRAVNAVVHVEAVRHLAFQLDTHSLDGQTPTGRAGRRPIAHFILPADVRHVRLVDDRPRIRLIAQRDAQRLERQRPTRRARRSLVGYGRHPADVRRMRLIVQPSAAEAIRRRARRFPALLHQHHLHGLDGQVVTDRARIRAVLRPTEPSDLSDMGTIVHVVRLAERPFEAEPHRLQRPRLPRGSHSSVAHFLLPSRTLHVALADNRSGIQRRDVAHLNRFQGKRPARGSCRRPVVHCAPPTDVGHVRFA